MRSGEDEEPPVAAGGYEQADVDTATGGVAEGLHHLGGGDEVGGLEINVAFALVEHLDGALHDGGAVAYGSGGEDVYRTVAAGLEVGEITLMVEEFSGCEAPVGEEGALHGGSGRTFDAHLGVAPGTPVEAFKVAFGDVHAAEVAYPAVDDHHFTVVAVVVVLAQ